MLRKAGSHALHLTLRSSAVYAFPVNAVEQLTVGLPAASMQLCAVHSTASVAVSRPASIRRQTQPLCDSSQLLRRTPATWRLYSAAADAVLKEEDPSSANGPATSTAAGRKAYPFPDGLGPNDELDRQREASQAAKANPFPDGHIAPHPGFQDHTESDSGNKGQGEVCYLLMNPVYEKDYLESVQPYHIPPVTVRQKVGFYAVQAMRRTFDLATGYKQHGMTEAKMLQRILFLETVAGVPGMVAGMLRHMRSLRAMKRDHGWIHTLLEESENERLHLLTFLQLREPGPLFRLMVLLGQGVFFNTYMAAYLLSPKTCHYFIGYLEEEAVKTYTHAIHTIDAGKLPEWNSLPVPKIAKDYWKLADDATMRDLLLNVRADEACHSHVNHTFGSLEPDADNPFAVGNHTVPQYHKQAVENGQPVPTYGKEQ